MDKIQREPSGRGRTEIRPLTIEAGVNRYAEGSALIRTGYTHVLCTASVDETVPKWLSGSGKGWITAEYSMLPRSTHTRSKRDREKVSGRTQEIQRLIGRGLRAMVDLGKLGERSITVDCDVLQADGGTRCAAVTGGCVALGIALRKLIIEGRIPREAWVDTVSAISIGLIEGLAWVDLDYREDSTCDVDMNFVITGRGGMVEIQGTGENSTFGKKELDYFTEAAMEATATLRAIQLQTLKKLGPELPF